MEIAIIGGGIIGLNSAYFLQKSGHNVTIFDDGDMDTNCSVGNAGMIVPSHIIPLSAPGMISKGFRWMFSAQSPFYVKPRLNGGLLKWGLEFYRHADQKHVDQAIPALKAISQLSKSLYQQMVRDSPFDFQYNERGLMMLYQTKEAEHEEAESARIANANGIEAQILSPKEVQDQEADVMVTVRGGTFYPGDAHLTPQLLVKNLIVYLRRNGVTIKPRTVVMDFEMRNNAIAGIITSQGKNSFDRYVLAAGAWSGILGAKLRLDLPMQGGKGYSFTKYNVERNISVPSILVEGRVAVTPMGDSLRFGGTMEINGVNRTVNMNRVRGIVNTIPSYYPDLTVDLPKREEVWNGLRPCSPDGLPYVGSSDQFKNLIVATGHSMIGLSLAPATGKLVSQIVNHEKTEIDLYAFRVNRYS